MTHSYRVSPAVITFTCTSPCYVSQIVVFIYFVAPQFTDSQHCAFSVLMEHSAGQLLFQEQTSGFTVRICITSFTLISGCKSLFIIIACLLLNPLNTASLRQTHICIFIVSSWCGSYEQMNLVLHTWRSCVNKHKVTK